MDTKKLTKKEKKEVYKIKSAMFEEMLEFWNIKTKKNDPKTTVKKRPGL